MVSNPSPTIMSLLKSCCPLTITRFVIAIVVNTFECQSRWAWSHFIQKRCNVIFPFFTHRNSTSTIILELFSPRIETSFPSMPPRKIFPIVAARCAAMLKIAISYLFSMETAAALSHAASKGCASDGGLLSALAMTQPTDTLWWFIFSATNYRKTTKLYPS